MRNRTLYFAYGSNLNQADLDAWCRRKGYSTLKLRKVANVRLNHFGIDFVGYSSRRDGSIATIVGPGEDVVYGVVFEVNDPELSVLDEKERAEGSSPSYIRKIVSVEKLSDHVELKDVLTYEAVSKTPGTPSNQYIEVIIEGARRHGLPPNWLTRLDSFEHQ